MMLKPLYIHRDDLSTYSNKNISIDVDSPATIQFGEVSQIPSSLDWSSEFISNSASAMLPKSDNLNMQRNRRCGRKMTGDVLVADAVGKVPVSTCEQQLLSITPPCGKMDNLPSIGSAQHLAGECRRCNFYMKGRCRNGYDCKFCHMPHGRRRVKYDRQEVLIGQEPPTHGAKTKLCEGKFQMRSIGTQTWDSGPSNCITCSRCQNGSVSDHRDEAEFWKCRRPQVTRGLINSAGDVNSKALSLMGTWE